MTTTVQSFQAVSLDRLLVLVNAYLAPLLSHKFTSFTFEAGDVQSYNAEYRVVIESIDGQAALVAPMILVGFDDPSLATVASELTTYIAANPTYFISVPYSCYLMGDNGRIKRNPSILATNTDAASGTAAWDISSGSGGGSPSGSGVANQVTVWSGPTVLTGFATFTFLSGLLTVGTGGTLRVNTNSAAPASFAAMTGNLYTFSGANGVRPRVVIDAYYNSVASLAPTLTFRSAQGTAAAPSAIQAGDNLADLGVQGYGSTAYQANARAFIFVVATATWSDTSQPYYTALRTVPTGSLTPVERMRLYDDGGVQIGGSYGASPGAGNLTVLSVDKAAVFRTLQQTLTGTGPTWDITVGALALWTLTGNSTLAAPTMADGDIATLQITNAAAGGPYTVTLTGTTWVDNVAAQVTQVASAVDLLVLSRRNGVIYSEILPVSQGPLTNGRVALSIAGGVVGDNANLTYSGTLSGGGLTIANTTQASSTYLYTSGAIVSSGAATFLGRLYCYDLLYVKNSTASASGNAFSGGPIPANGLMSWLVGADSQTTTSLIDSFGTSITSLFAGRSARGTAASPTAVQLDDTLAQFAGYGYGATAHSTVPRAYMSITASQTWTDTIQGCGVRWFTTINGGVVTSEKMRLWNDGGLTLSGTMTATPGPNCLAVAGTVASTTSTTGALTVAGGAGIAGNLVLGGGIADGNVSKTSWSAAGSLTVAAGVWSVINSNTSTISSFTVTMPAAPAQGQMVRLFTSGQVTLLTFLANSGQTIQGGAALILAANSSAMFIYSGTIWYRG